MAETGSEKSKRGGDGDRHVVRSNPTEGGGAKRDRRGEPQASSFQPPYAEIRKGRLSPIPKRGLGREVETDEYE